MRKRLSVHAEIRQIFKASGVGNIAGAIVTEGRITKDSIVRITRDKEQIYEGPIATLKHFKDDVKEVKAVLNVVWYLRTLARFRKAIL